MFNFVFKEATENDLVRIPVIIITGRPKDVENLVVLAREFALKSFWVSYDKLDRPTGIEIDQDPVSIQILNYLPEGMFKVERKTRTELKKN